MGIIARARYFPPIQPFACMLHPLRSAWNTVTDDVTRFASPRNVENVTKSVTNQRGGKRNFLFVSGRGDRTLTCDTYVPKVPLGARW
jgi:hypothetical protein